MQPQDAVAMDEKNYEAMLQKSQAQQREGPGRQRAQRRATEGRDVAHAIQCPVSASPSSVASVLAI